MGCAVSNAQTLCKGIGVENDKPGIMSRARGMLSNNDEKSDMHATIADATHNGTDVINNMCGHRMAFENNETTGNFTQKMTSLENDLVEKGRNTFGAISNQGHEAMKSTIVNVESFGKNVEDTLKSGVNDLTKTGMDAMNDVSHIVEEDVSEMSEAVNNKVEDTKDKVGEIFNFGEKESNDIKKNVVGSKEDLGEKIDEILAINLDENS